MKSLVVKIKEVSDRDLKLLFDEDGTPDLGFVEFLIHQPNSEVKVSVEETREVVRPEHLEL